MSLVHDHVSICIPTYNGAAYLRDCLESVLDQSYIHTEILIVDDCSTDETLSIAEEYAKYDNRIKVYKNEENLGLVGNWNKCIDLASYDWIKFAFQDDILLTNCVQDLYLAAKVNACKISICNRRYVIDSTANPAVKNYILKDLIKLNKYYSEDTFITPSKVIVLAKDNMLMNIFGEPTSLLFHKDVITKYGYFNPDLAQMVDYEFVLRVAGNEGLAWVQDSHVFFRIHGGNQTNVNRGDGRSETKRLKIEYIDAALMLHDFVYHKDFGSIQADTEINAAFYAKYKAEVLKGIDQIGKQKLEELAKPYAQQYPRLLDDIKSFNL